MRRAIRLAKKGRGQVSPNPMVGAVVVRRGEVIGQGCHRRAGGAHAEVEAISQARRKVRGADLYANLEPCSHVGRTPPCTELIIESGIQKVFVGMKDPNPLVSGKGIDRLKAAGIGVAVGIEEQKCRELNEVFVKYITQKVPFVILKVAATLDGKIATETGDSRGISGEKALGFVHRLRDEVDAILVGIGTVLSDDPLLTTRLKGTRGKDPVRVIVDGQLKIPLNAKVLNLTSAARTLVAATNRASRDKAKRIEELGHEVVTVTSRGGRVDLKALLKELGRREVTSLLIEGGTEIITSALKGGIVDKACFIYAPKIVGGGGASGITGGKGVRWIRDALPLEKVKVKRLGPDIFVEGYPKKGAT
jgi:diaminohydroxyphosphoribosylaminopyrimidine deaminase/5-amino-6-(5-phosphoribosylamino)uracil reductase